MTAYDTNKIRSPRFCAASFPSYKVYEDDHVLAFLDIMPRCDGPHAW